MLLLYDKKKEIYVLRDKTLHYVEIDRFITCKIILYGTLDANSPNNNLKIASSIWYKTS